MTETKTSKVSQTLVSSSHQGARDYQEDRCGHWMDQDSGELFVMVADGAGGHGGGAEAAQAALDVAASAWGERGGAALGSEFLEVWMSRAHAAVNEAALKIHHSARAVVVACVTDGCRASWVHAGDCRLLRFRKGKLIERTRDDSVVQVLFERGEVSEDEMGTHPDQSRLLQSLGGEDAPSPRLGTADLEPGDALILCSDGFWEHLKNNELEKIIGQPLARRQMALDRAVAAAVARGGAKADNTTAIMIHVPAGIERSAKRRSWIWLLLIALVALSGMVTWCLGYPLSKRQKGPIRIQNSESNISPRPKDPPAPPTEAPPARELGTNPTAEMEAPSLPVPESLPDSSTNSSDPSLKIHE